MRSGPVDAQLVGLAAEAVISRVRLRPARASLEKKRMLLPGEIDPRVTAIWDTGYDELVLDRVRWSFSTRVSERLT